MRLHLLSSLALVLLGSLTACRAQDSASSALETLPNCAIECLATAVLNSPCSFTNQTCLCTNARLQDDVTGCVTVNCTVKESLFTKNVTESNCHVPLRDKTKLISNVGIILGTITGFLVVGRLAFKQFVAKTGWSADDWAILATTIVGVPSTVLGVHGTAANGLGKDVWTLPFDKISNFGLYFYIIEILYFADVALLKTSILLFYLRIFPTPRTRKALWATLIVNGMFGVAFVVAAIFQCTPISYYWENWHGEVDGMCLNVNAIGWSNAIISIVIDIWMIAIPLSQLPKLRLHWKRKLGVGLMFCVGIFVTIVSILRLQSLVSFANSHNPTWDNWSVSNWSIVEINVGIICACMPTARLALMRAFTVFRETTNRSGYYGYPNQGSKSGAGPRSRTAATPSSAPTASKTPSGAITYQKSFTVQYSDHDEASLVHMRDLDAGGRDGRESQRTVSVSSS